MSSKDEVNSEYQSSRLAPQHPHPKRANMFVQKLSCERTIMLKHSPKTQEIVICQSHGNNGAGKKMVSNRHELWYSKTNSKPTLWLPRCPPPLVLFPLEPESFEHHLLPGSHSSDRVQLQRVPEVAPLSKCSFSLLDFRKLFFVALKFHL